jgi:catechol 2,3-dioxygenase-like lactoylglutathione lyase family enzyme
MSTGADVKLAKVGTVMLAVADLPRAVAFYRDVLGVPVKYAVEEFAFLDGGPVMIGLRRSPNLPQGENLRAEIVFEVDDVEAAHRALTARGVEFRHAPRQATGDRYVADFRDPDGNAISIFGPRGAQ